MFCPLQECGKGMLVDEHLKIFRCTECGRLFTLIRKNETSETVLLYELILNPELLKPFHEKPPEQLELGFGDSQ